MYENTPLKRHLASTVKRLATHFPVVTLTGPRQSGKTTLVKALFPEKPYVSLEDPTERAFAKEDPRGFFSRFPAGAIFDEAQRWPDLFSYIQGIVDQQHVPGLFILTGSQQFGLLAGITQSLAGRVGLATLLPLSLAELFSDKHSSLSNAAKIANQCIFQGFYPGLVVSKNPLGRIDSPLNTRRVNDWYASYVATYIERDVRQLIKIQDLSVFQKFLKLCAARVGQLLNIANLANETGINNATAKAWLSVLEASYVVRLLSPYHRNFGKRLVKSPKLYFFDTGLVSYLLGIRSVDQIHLHPLRGALFENLVVGEALKTSANIGEPRDLYFWRDNNGVEADLIFETTHGLQTVEIKSGETITGDSVRAGKKSASFVTETLVLEPWLVHGGNESYTRSEVQCIPWIQFSAALANTPKGTE